MFRYVTPPYTIYPHPPLSYREEKPDNTIKIKTTRLDGMSDALETQWKHSQ
ncbi:hypothetical protein [Endozoicomonas atrinae]|uniref:hypothetical protein n=1 Tax=Endozoicomonas atrinae TaxID=1333660 RepID=UPI003AFF75B1